ncbi:MAG TPA: TIGR04211 family SH3 domain-containing protein [Steroidobacteraceae bacterium]|nr:TIGR04211 family SH3 domain-containing protein [Steroidobacteraceae bacterium]
MIARCLLYSLLLAPLAAAAETAYVSDKLVVGVYATASTEGERLAQLSTGDSVEVLARDLEYAQVRLEDGREGWIRNSYLSSEPPAAAKIPALQAQVQKLTAAAEKNSQATTQPAADAKKIAELQKALDAARAALASKPQTEPAQAPAAASSSQSDEVLPIEPIGADLAYRRKAWIWGIAVALFTFGAGFGVGWILLDRRIRARYGGLRVY